MGNIVQRMPTKTDVDYLISNIGIPKEGEEVSKKRIGHCETRRASSDIKAKSWRASEPTTFLQKERVNPWTMSKNYLVLAFLMRDNP